MRLIQTISGTAGTAKAYRDSENGEYVVRFTGRDGARRPDADYFTDDKSDALGTARAMVEPCPMSA